MTNFIMLIQFFFRIKPCIESAFFTYKLELFMFIIMLLKFIL